MPASRSYYFPVAKWQGYVTGVTSSHQRGSMKKSVLKNFAIFLRCFPVNIAKLLRTPNLKFTESLHRIFLYLIFTCFSSVFYGIFEQFHVQFFTTVEALYLNFLIFLSLLSRITLTNRIIHNVKNIFILHINIDCKFIVV